MNKSANPGANPAGLEELAQSRFEYASLSDSQQSSTSNISFAALLVRKRRWFFAAICLGAIVGFFLGLILPASFKSEGKIGFATPQEFLPVRYIIGGKGDTAEKAAFDSVQLVKSMLNKVLQNPNTLGGAADKYPEVFSSLFASDNTEEVENFYYRKLKILPPSTDPSGRNEEDPNYTITLQTDNPDSSIHALRGYLEVITEKTNQTVIDELFKIMQTRIRIAEAAYDAAKASRQANFKIAEDLLLDDIRLAKRAEFEKPAFNVSRTDLADMAITNIYPRYFFGYNILEQELEILRKNALQPERLPEYIDLVELKDRAKYLLEVISESRMQLISSQVTSRPSGLSNLLRTVFLTILGAIGFGLLWLLYLAQIQLVSLFDERK